MVLHFDRRITPKFDYNLGSKRFVDIYNTDNWSGNWTKYTFTHCVTKNIWQQKPNSCRRKQKSHDAFSQCLYKRWLLWKRFGESLFFIPLLFSPSDSKIVICLQGSHMLLFPAVFPREKQIDRDENGDLEQVEDS